jgi:hypothetical protein
MPAYTTTQHKVLVQDVGRLQKEHGAVAGGVV